MTESLHGNRRKPRPWTAQEQTTLEVAAACDVPIKEIAAVLDRCTQMLRKHVGPGSTAERKRVMAEYQKVYGAANRDRKRATHKAWYLANRKRKNAANKAWKIANRERVSAINHAYHVANSEQRSALARLRYQANRERITVLSKAWYEANRQRKLATVMAWRAANLDRYNAAHKAWAINNPERCNEILRRRRARLRVARQFIQITYKQKCQRFLLWNNCCSYCGKDGKTTVDHVLAIKHGGLDEPLNIVPACRSCNSSKHASPVESWYRRQPFFTEARWRKIQRHCPAAVAGQLPLALPA
jgi:5-methylcytosine-specific restriction endonuclease McrA